MKEIKLTQGKVTKVDDEDYEYLNQWKWHISGNNKYTYYAMRKDSKTFDVIMMHRIIMNTPKKLEVDHIDHDGLNNQKLNLRNCTHSENIKNSRLKHSRLKHISQMASSTHKSFLFNAYISYHIGYRKYINKAKEEKIYYSKPKYVLCVKYNNKLKYIGRFKTHEEAIEKRKELI